MSVLLQKTCDKFTNTNLHVEAFHKILKYSYFKCKRNKWVENLMSMLLKISNDFEEKERIEIKRRSESTSIPKQHCIITKA